MSEFTGFPSPTRNFFSLPNEMINIIAGIKSLSELKVILYVVRHTWGFQEYGVYKTISVDEFMHGRKQIDRETGKVKRMDSGTGLSQNSVIDALKAAEQHGYLISVTDSSDLARVKKSYALKMIEPPATSAPPANLAPGAESTPSPATSAPGSEESAPHHATFADRSEKDTRRKTLKKDTEERQGDTALDAPTPARAFFASLPIPLTYNDALVYLAPHGGPPEGYDAVQVMQLARKLWVEEHEEEPTPARAEIASLNKQISDTQGRIQAIKANRLGVTDDECAPDLSGEDETVKRPTPPETRSIMKGSLNDGTGDPQRAHDALRLSVHDGRAGAGADRSGSAVAAAPVAAPATQPVRGAEPAVNRSTGGATVPPPGDTALLSRSASVASESRAPGATVHKTRTVGAAQPPLSLKDDAPRPLSEKTLRTRYEAHFWSILDDVRKERGLKPLFSARRIWCAKDFNQAGINDFYADQISDEDIRAAYLTVLDQRDEWLRVNFTVPRFYTNLPGLLDAKPAQGKQGKRKPPEDENDPYSFASILKRQAEQATSA